jgi:Ca-activated chloride channel family protein
VPETCRLFTLGIHNSDVSMFISANGAGPLHPLMTAWSGRTKASIATGRLTVFSLHHLNTGRQEKKSLLLVSDGGDNASRHTSNDVIEAVRESRAIIYTIGIFDEDDSDRNPRLLRRLADVSGGSAFFPKELPDITRICHQIASDIRDRYTIGYVPAQTVGNDLHSISVSAARGGEKFLVRARTSYRFPKESLK